VVATLAGPDKPEFLLMTSFTPRTKQNLVGVMLARCDGEQLGEIQVLELSKQALTPGPMQIAAAINQDQNISKDLTLWNQQGSQVLRGQMLILPLDKNFLYVEPIYLQATEARMPQLKKVVLALGSKLVYADTYEQALAQLTGGVNAAPAQPSVSVSSTTPGTAPPIAASALESVRAHFEKYRQLQGQGKFAEAGRELEAIEHELTVKRP
jgi:uncharacterized membrane protein (UPF0182 family)